MPEKTRFELKNGVTLVSDYYDNSSNKGIVLFPGFTEHRSSLEDIAEVLNKDFKVWAVDINSQGESSGNFDLREMAQSVYELLRQLKQRHGLLKIGVHGNSIGGMSVGLTAAQNDSKIDCICLASTPAGLQDIVSGGASAILSYVPQSLVRLCTIAFDKFESIGNERYRQKSHTQFQQNGEYQPYAQFGALKIKNIRDVMKWLSQAPRLDKCVRDIRQPTLIIYGGNDKVLCIKQDILPPQLARMYDCIGSADKRLIIVHGADHSLNSSTQIEDCFNQEPKFQYVKTEIFNHFANYLV